METNLIPAPIHHVQETTTCCCCPINERDLVWENERGLCCGSWPWKHTTDKWFIDQQGRIQVRRDLGPPLCLCCLTWSCSLVMGLVTAMICGGSGTSACSCPAFSSIVINKDPTDDKIYMQFQRKSMCSAESVPRRAVVSAEVLNFKGRGSWFTQMDLHHVIIRDEKGESYYSLAEEGESPSVETGGGGCMNKLAAAINTMIQQGQGGGTEGANLTMNIMRS